ncbi:MAG: MMPL family transporter, partial [Gammaproteobacteria bacterium]|nr:MMPL family transporter [Gammaproteobacteria bacterium]
MVLVITILSIYISVSELRINTNTEDMISADLPWRQHQIQFKKNFPQLVRNIVVVIDGYTPEIADQSRTRLAALLRDKPTIFRTVYEPGGGAFFENNGLLFLSEDEFTEFTDQIADAQPFLRKLAQQPSLETLFTLLQQAVEEQRYNTSLDNVFSQLSLAFKAENDKRFHRLSWQELFQSDTTDKNRRRLLLIEPELHDNKPVSRKTALKELKNILDTQDFYDDPGITVRITGSMAMEQEELQSVSRGALITGLATLLLVTGVLWLALSSPNLIAASIITLVAGLSITAAFAAIAIGSLNIISVAFAILYIGLGVDFAIHFCTHVREHSTSGNSLSNALVVAAREVGPSLFICTITTAVGFYAFIPTDFSGISQLGIISGTGMFISFALSLSLLPALIAKFNPHLTAPTNQRSLISAIGKTSVKHDRTIRWLSMATLVIAVLLASQIQFDNNPVNLRDQDTESVKTFLDLIANSNTPPLTLSVLSSDSETASTTALALREYDEVKETVWVESFIPEQQDEKLALVDETNLILGGALPEPAAPVSNPESDLAGIDAFTETLSNNRNKQSEAVQELLKNLWVWRTQSSNSGDTPDMNSLTSNVLSTLPLLIKRLNNLLNTDRVSMDTLPESISKRWISDDGLYRIEALPNENVNEHDAAARFLEAVESSAPNATGLPAIHIKAGATVVSTFRTAFIIALMLIGALLLILFRRLRDS